MAAPPGPNPANDWLAERYAAYYRRHPPQAPDRLGKREYGFLFFGQKGMLRHVGFARKQDFERFHAERAPAHSYYSTAFYQRPDAPTMQEKGWMGAELIFDLDADHVPGSEKLPYPQQLARVKEHFVRLVDEFVVEDLGFAEKELLLTFSGGRGYHCHVLAERALGLSSQERREIVDYVTGTGLIAKNFVWTEKKARRKGAFSTLVPTTKITAATDPGWGGKVNRGVRRFVAEMRGKNRDEILAYFSDASSIGQMRLRMLLRELQALGDRDFEGTDKLGKMEQGWAAQGKVLETLVPLVVGKHAIPLQKGETDEPVTSDTKRLIRTPGSLHGKSGLRVVTLTRSALDDFDPLRDAVAFGNESIDVTVTRPMTVSLKGETLKLDPGKARVPEYAAVFAALLGAAVPAP